MKNLFSSGGRNILFHSVFLILILLHLLTFLNLRVYPFVDLPMHLAIGTIFRFYGAADNQFSQFYLLDFSFQPNTFHPLFCSFRFFPTIEFGNKVFFSLYLILLPLSLFLIVKRLGGNLWYTIALFPILYNYNVHWGFVGFVISIPLFLLFFYSLINYSPGIWNAKKLILAIFFLLFFFTHILAGFFTLFFFLLFILWHFWCKKISLKSLLKESIVILPFLIIISIWWQRKKPYEVQDLLLFLFHYYKAEYLPTFLARARLMILDNRHLYPGFWGRFAGLFFSISLLAPTVFWLYKKKVWKSFFAAMRNYPLSLPFLLAFASLFSYLLLPDRLPGEWSIYQRFSVYFFLAVIMINSIVFAAKFRRVGIFFISLISFFHFLLYLDYFRSFAQETSSFTKDIFPQVRQNQKLAGLIFDYQFRGKPIYIHFPDYYIIWCTGIATTSFLDYRFTPVSRKVGNDILPPYEGFVGQDRIYDGRYANMDYLLVRGEIPNSAKEKLEGFKMVKSLGNWFLYKKNDGN
ncbi:MAG: hypothetical protein ABIK81_04755 [candidate division WOR-3 bacterium]